MGPHNKKFQRLCFQVWATNKKTAANCGFLVGIISSRGVEFDRITGMHCKFLQKFLLDSCLGHSLKKKLIDARFLFWFFLVW